MNAASTPASSFKKHLVQITKQGTSGKVTLSDKVKNMEMSFSQSFNFSSVGSWSPANISQIEIVFPVLTPKNESTNALTRSTRPEARY